MRALKPETEIRNLKRENRELRERCFQASADAGAFRARATRAEQDAAEWKRRFDELLSKCRDFDYVVPAPVTLLEPK